MSGKIKKAYTFTVAENAIIKTNFTTHSDWDKAIFSDIKENIRDFLRPEQDNKCCYCKRELEFDIKSVDIEHIIPKSQHENFTFNPLNLALSCPGCNTKKGDDNILTKTIVRYPKHSKNISIIHAHYDDYKTHIKIHTNCVFEGRTKKGAHTITTCELFRIKTVLEKAKNISKTKTPSSKLVADVMEANPEELAEIMIEISKRIK
jgi:uncharacterized protein (TIGR02646 family)